MLLPKFYLSKSKCYITLIPDMTCLGGYIHRHIKRWLVFSVFTGMWAYIHSMKEGSCNGEYTDGCLCYEKLTLCMLFLGQYVHILYMHYRFWRVNFHPRIFQNKCKHVREGLSEIQPTFSFFLSIRPAHTISVSLVKHMLLRKCLCCTHWF